MHNKFFKWELGWGSNSNMNKTELVLFAKIFTNNSKKFDKYFKMI